MSAADPEVESGGITQVHKLLIEVVRLIGIVENARFAADGNLFVTIAKVEFHKVLDQILERRL
jgi:hypothetical protein